MFKIEGKYTSAKVFASEIDEKAIQQINEICNQEFLKDCPIAIMPDVHYGSNISIGTVIKIKDKIKASYVSSDIGCGVLAIKIDSHDIDFKKLDGFINENIPTGANIHDFPIHTFERKKDLLCAKLIKNYHLIDNALMTLGGGNHFLEMDIDSNGDYWLIVHTGSKNLGTQIEKFYTNLAYKNQNGHTRKRIDGYNELIQNYRNQKRFSEINKVKEDYINTTPEMIYSSFQCYLYNEYFYNYLHDMEIVQEYASLNRKYILEYIINAMGWKEVDKIESVHNYIDIKNYILRKGAISAQKDEKVVIPLSMADGVIIGVGKGNKEYLNSAPHGAGRKLSRSVAKETLSMDDFEKSMKGIYSTSICPLTLDESPMAYKDSNVILNDIKDTVDVKLILKPVYNFKSHELFVFKKDKKNL